MSKDAKGLLKPQQSEISGEFEPRNFGEARALAEYLAKSNIVPKDMQGKPENICIALMMGREIGLKSMQAIQNIMVVNGRPSLWGDAVLALIKGHPDTVSFKETAPDEIEKTGIAQCAIGMRGQELVVRKFTTEMAIKAGLTKKSGPWQEYRSRMLQMRARAWAARDAAPHILKGLSIVEEVRDIEEAPTNDQKPEIKMPQVVEAQVVPPPATEAVAPAALASEPINVEPLPAVIAEPIPAAPPAFHAEPANYTADEVDILMESGQGKHLIGLCEKSGLPQQELRKKIMEVPGNVPLANFWVANFQALAIWAKGGFHG